MYIKSITLKNYGPFKDTQSIEFKQDSPIILIQGAYTDNIRKSNRAGKSTLVEAILYLLFGHTRKSLKEIDLIHNGQTEMSVTGVFCIDGKDITITRGRNSKNVATFEVTGLDNNKKSDKQKDLEALIGYNITDFCSVFFFKQNDMHFFMEQGATDKKRLLQGWFKLDKWFGYEAKAKDKYNHYKNLCDSNQTLKTVLQTKFDQIEIENEYPIKAEIETRSMSLTNSIDRVSDLKTALSQLPKVDQLQDELGKVNLSLKDINNKIATCDKVITQWVNQEAERNKIQEQYIYFCNELKNYPPKQELEQSLQTLSDQYNENCTQLRLEKENLKKAEKELDPFKKFNGICPIDNQGCDKGSRLPEKRLEIENRINTHKQEIERLDQLTNFKPISEIKDQLSIISNIEHQIRVNTLQPLDLQGLKAKEEALKQDYLTQQAALKAKLSELTNKIAETYNCNKEKELQEQINKELQLQSLLKAKMAELNNKLGQIKQAVKSKLELNKQISELTNKILLDKQAELQYNYITQAFGKGGIPSILIENNLSYLEEVANLILSHISPTTKIEFSTTREVSTKETNCRVCGSPYPTNNNKCSCGYGIKSNSIKDELNLKVYEGNRELAFNQDSGGGNCLVTLALRIALSQLLSKDKPIQFMVLDEIMAQIDSVRREEVTKLLMSVLPNLGGYKNIFIISHTDINDFGTIQTINIVRDESKDFSVIKC